jgi:hypothetical protein
LAVHARRHLARQHDTDVQIARVSAADAGEHDRNECDCTHMKNPLKEIGESGRALKSSLATSLMHCRPPRKSAPLIKRHLAGIRRQLTTLLGASAPVPEM